MEYLALKKEFADAKKLHDDAKAVAKNPNDAEVLKHFLSMNKAEQAMNKHRQAAIDKKKPQYIQRLKEAQKALLKPFEDAVLRAEQQQRSLAGEVARLEALETPEFRAKFARAKALEANRVQLQEQITRINLDGDELPWVVPSGEATVPGQPDRMAQIRAAALGGGGVFLLLLFSVALVEFRRRRVSSSDEVTQGLGIPTVGTVPMLPARVLRAALGTGAVRDSYWQGRLTESVDALRTFLLRALGEGPHVIMVTSAMQGEGKTSLASQLAASLARAWRKTLLIDGDLRKPAAHKLFELPVEPGLSEVLRGELDLGDVIRPTTVGRLWLMPAGQWDAHALQALAQEGAGNFFEQLREEYEFIIVDSCPVLPVTDTLLLGQHVDTVLFSVLRGTSRLPTLYAAWQRLAALEISVLGAVVAGGQSALGGLDIQYPRPAGS
jgi:capsular exopolysaccharide synthesis family protein